MDRLIKNLHWVVILILGIIAVVFYEIAGNNKRALQEQIEFNNAKAIRDSILVRQVIRAKDDAAFRYRDSLRQQKINYIKLQNEKQRVRIIRDIKYLPAADDSTKDDIWLNSWGTEDSLLY